jgi:hypothetical protein
MSITARLRQSRPSHAGPGAPEDDLAPPSSAGLASSYWLTRAVVLRGLGAIYAVAFSILVFQGEGLIGSRGLLPAADYLKAVLATQESFGRSFFRLPTLFLFSASDTALMAASVLGLLLALVVTAGIVNAPILLALWALYLSFVHVGQIFYGYGWDILLCEAGILAVFLAPPLRPTLFSEASPPPLPIVILFRWLTFRLMFGAGMIKIRGDECWRELTCLDYHYETQPNPSPLSYYFHSLPELLHRAGVLFNHFVELVAPFGVFGPRRVRLISGALIGVFQLLLIASGNLSFLNWLTLVIALAVFDDGVFARFAGAGWRERVEGLTRTERAPSRARRVTVWAFVIVVALLSLNPVVNLLSPRQRMNASFDPFKLVNTYGAFGSVGRERFEVVLEGTDARELDPETTFREYEFPCKPGAVDRRPCLVTPYHYRLDWQLWFAALGDFRSQPWILNLVYQLLRGEPSAKRFLAVDPFPDAPPRYIRARLYRYRFSEERDAGKYWERELVGEYLNPLSLDHPEFLRVLERRGWLSQN